jgi:hypothetical protein
VPPAADPLFVLPDADADTVDEFLALFAVLVIVVDAKELLTEAGLTDVGEVMEDDATGTGDLITPGPRCIPDA